MGKNTRKDLYELVKISNRWSGRGFTTGVLMRLMGYSDKTRFYSTNGCYFVKAIYLNGGVLSRNPVYEFGSWILTPNFPKILIDENKPVAWRHRLLHDGFNSAYFEREKLYLIPKGALPFYLLKEYGGEY